MQIRIYNTLTRKVETFEPFIEGLVRMYVCGPTVYDHTHIGHARTYVAFDAIKKYFMLRGYTVVHVQNITDIDDKIINRSKELGIDWRELVDIYSKEYFELMERLGVRPNLNPRVTEHIEDIIEFVDDLIKKGFAYVTKSGVYFEVDKYPYYGQLSRVEKSAWKQEYAEDKKKPYDFALWKCAKPGEPWWESPWCKGRPGWHIECSTMSSKYLGRQFEIHGGARDLIFPHHENEIAQSEARFGVHPWVKYWMHTGYLTVKGEKMSKSLGNIVPLKDVLSKYDPKVVRYWLLSAHYRTELDFSWERLEEAKRAVERIRMAIDYNNKILRKGERKGSLRGKEFDDFKRAYSLILEFHKAMSDDFNTPKAIAILHEASSLAQNNESWEVASLLDSLFRQADFVFNIATDLLYGGPQLNVEQLINLIVEVRKELRMRKMWDLSDKIRDELAKMGVKLLDKGKETEWRFA